MKLTVNSEELTRLYINQLPMMATILVASGNMHADDAAEEAVAILNAVLDVLADAGVDFQPM